jgi:hypothetical protein
MPERGEDGRTVIYRGEWSADGLSCDEDCLRLLSKERTEFQFRNGADRKWERGRYDFSHSAAKTGLSTENREVRTPKSLTLYLELHQIGIILPATDQVSLSPVD